GYATGCRGDGPRGTYMDVVVAPDGASVYGNVQDPAFAWGAVAHLRRSPDGGLAYAGCVGEGQPALCRQIGPTGVMNHAGTLLAPSSRVLYSLGVHWRGALSQFARQSS
ncbi:hypothetical protein AB0K48_51420, partial [Nonomuraea sp. NPDC055795]